MSHFSVLVVGGKPEQQLAPYHEFECTGTDDQYVVDIDVTKEHRKAFSGKVTRYRDPNGVLYDPCDDQFYREPTPAEMAEHKPMFGSGYGGGISWFSKDWKDGRGYRAKVHFLPEIFKEVKVPRAKVESFRHYVTGYRGRASVPFGQEPDLKDKHKYGYCLLDEKGKVVKVVDRTNPNAKWDWHLLGGRWTGFFKLKELAVIGDAFTPEKAAELGGEHGVPTALVIEYASLLKDGNQKNIDLFNDRHVFSYALQKSVTELVTLRYPRAKVGSPGLMTAIAKAGYVDQARKCDIDFDGMRAEAKKRAEERWDRFARLMGGEVKPPKTTWKQFLNGRKYKGLDIDEKRVLYHAQPELVKLKGLTPTDEEDRSLAVWADYEEYAVGREAYVERNVLRNTSTFAVVMGGKWYARGEMGWFASVSGEKKEGQWVREFAKLLDGISDNTLLSVYDCHV